MKRKTALWKMKEAWKQWGASTEFWQEVNGILKEFEISIKVGIGPGNFRSNPLSKIPGESMLRMVYEDKDDMDQSVHDPLAYMRKSVFTTPEIVEVKILNHNGDYVTIWKRHM